jgi:RNA polymerase sigma-70 factor (ECF subfamily)
MDGSTLFMPRLVADTRFTDQDAPLVTAAQGGDRDAFGTLVERHQQRVFKLAGRFFRRREDVEEAAQETFLTAWRKLDTYRAKAPFENWLTRVCLNSCYMRLRKTKPEEELPLDLPAPRSGHDARLDAERLLGHLPPRDRFLLLLLHGEGWSTAEIAARTGWSRSNVKVRAYRARRKLQKFVEAAVKESGG